MAAAGTRAAGRLAGAHPRDLRPARQAADRLGQRPADDRPHLAAVYVVALTAETRHVARVGERSFARVCSAPQRRTATIARARVRIGRTRTEHARRAGAVGRAAPLPRADHDRVHHACKPEPTSTANASGGYNGRRTLRYSFHERYLLTRAASERHRRNSAEESGRRVVCVLEEVQGTPHRGRSVHGCCWWERDSAQCATISARNVDYAVQQSVRVCSAHADVGLLVGVLVGGFVSPRFVGAGVPV